MSRYLFAAVLTLVSFFADSASAQEFPMLHFTKEDGLPSNTIYSVYRTSKGFLWVATDKGIARYNGLKFEVFTTYDGLPDDEIFFFKEDLNGRLWIAAYNGQLCYYQNDTFHTAANTPWLRTSLKRSDIGDIYVYDDSSVVIQPFDFSFFFLVEKNRVRAFDLKNLMEKQEARAIFYKKRLSANQFKIYERNNDFIVDSSLNIISKKKRKYNYYLRASFCQDSHIFLDRNYVYDIDERPLFKIGKGIPDSTVHCVYLDSNFHFLITRYGVYYNDTNRILPNIQCSGMTRDSYGNYWISTLDHGLYCVKRNFLNTRLYPDQYKSEIKYVCARNNKIYFTNTDNNLFLLKNGEVRKLFDYRKFKHGVVTLVSDAAYLVDDSDNYFNIYNRDQIIIENVSSGHQKISKSLFPYRDIGVKAIFKSDGGLIVKDRASVLIGYRDTQSDRFHFRYASDSLDYGKTRIFGMARDASGSVWYSLVDTVYKIVDGRPIKQRQFDSIAFKIFTFFGNDIVGYTFGNKMLVCHNVSGPLQIDSLPSYGCIWNKLFRLDSAHLLVSTNNYYRIITAYGPPEKRKFSISTIENPFIPMCDAICADSANCYFFSDGSITSISISELFKKVNPPKLFFKLLRTNKKNYRIDSSIELPFSEARNITLSYRTLSFGGKDVFYQYSVSKNEADNWRDIKGEEINLLQPGYGTYVIKVRAKTMSSDPSEPAVFTLHILRPYWATWWFAGICIVLAILLAAAIIRVRIIYLVKRKERLHENEVKFLKSEFKALNALMNPHFIFNTLNNVQSLFNNNDKLAANEYLRIFADLIRQNMQNVSKELISLQKEMALVMNYLMLEKLRFEDKLNYEFNVEEDIDLSEIMVPPLLIQPLVENSIKHGIFPLKRGTVQVNIFTHNNVLQIEIRDNGMGMTAKDSSDLSHESFGLLNIRRRIQQLSIIQNKEISLQFSEIKDDFGKHLWTVVTISIPL